MILFDSEEKILRPTQAKTGHSMFITDSGIIQVLATQDGILSISGPGVKKVIVHSPHRTIPIIRRSG